MHGGLAGNNKHDALAVLAAEHPALILLTETHASQFDYRVPNLQGYGCISKPWPQTQQARQGPPRGGIAVFVADGIRQHVKEWKVADDGTYVILELAAGLLLPEERTTYLAVCYVPPKRGRNCNLETFDDLQRDLAELPLARLRLSCNELRVCTDRIVKSVRPPREQRLCRLCSLGAVEDELHILTTCPALAALCAGCPDLQREHTNLASVFTNCELHTLGWFACQALRKHSHLLEAMGQPLWPAGYVPQSNSRPGRQRLRR